MGAPQLLVRPAALSDANAIAGIYEPIVRDTAISFETEPPNGHMIAQRVAVVTRTHPWLVAVEARQVVGYAYASGHRERAAYRWSVDVTAYVASGMRGRGVGRLLYDRLIPILRMQGFHAAFAGITLPNDASVALHEAMGFEAIGVYREVGFKLGQWHDVSWWRLGLAQGTTSPAEPMSFEVLRTKFNLGDLLK